MSTTIETARVDWGSHAILNEFLRKSGSEDAALRSLGSLRILPSDLVRTERAWAIARIADYVHETSR